MASYGTGSLPSPTWPASPPASSDSVLVTSYTRDKLGRATTVTDPAGMETTYDYDMLGRKTEEIRDAGQGGLAIKTTWLYDQWDGANEVYYDVIEAWEDAENHQDTEYVYGAAKHPYKVTTTTYPDTGDVVVAYNDDGTVATVLDQRGWTTTYTYDDALRVTAEAVSGSGLVGTSAVAYAYDALGRPTSVTDNNDPSDGNDNSTVEWTYTREAAEGDLEVEETQKYGTAADRDVTYRYDLSGRLESVEYPSALTLSYTYDDIGRPYVVNDGTNDRVEDTWKGYLLERREYASGAYLTHLDDSSQNLSGYGYDAFGRIKNHRWKASGGSLIAGWAHEYDRLGNKDYSEDLVLTTTDDELYGYDGVYRLTSFERGALNANKDDITSPDRSQTWSLDPLGNWDETEVDSVTETRVHNSVNELTARTVGQNPQISLTYDNAGNLSQDGSADGHHQYVWDYRNRLIEVKEYQTDTWNSVAEYKYDAVGRRALKIVTNKGDLNGTTRFLWGGEEDWQCLEERDGSGDLVARYTYAPGYIDDVAVQERDLNDDQDFGDANEVVYYHQNALFSVYALTDGSETVAERYRYDAYGACTVLDADGSADSDAISDVGNAYAFTGRRLDLESDLMQYRHRYYAPTLGRFVSRDPQEYLDAFGLYEYVGGDPVLYQDPLGSSILGTAWRGVKWTGGKIGAGAKGAATGVAKGAGWVAGKGKGTWQGLNRWRKNEGVTPCPKRGPPRPDDRGWCKDSSLSGVYHEDPCGDQGNCYRQVDPTFGAQQCCYVKDGCCDSSGTKWNQNDWYDDSPDRVRAVKRDADGNCVPANCLLVAGHWVCDVVPWGVIHPRPFIGGSLRGGGLLVRGGLRRAGDLIGIGE